MYNKKVLNRATAGLDKAKAPAKKKDIIVDPMGQWKHPGENTRIPSSNITMQGVNYPVLGVGSNGQEQMMYPGMEYTFPGADYVDEFPQGTDEDYFEADLTDAEIEEYRKGGYIVEDISVPELTKAQKGVATQADSLSVYNNALRQKAYYDKLKPYYRSVDISPWDNMNTFNVLKDMQRQHLNYDALDDKLNRYMDVKKKTIKANKDPNKLYLLDMVPELLDPYAPLLEYNKNIKPQGVINYKPKGTSVAKDKLPGWVTTLPYYDPLAVKPGNMLTPAEVKARVKKYGTSGIPASKLKGLTSTNKKPSQTITKNKTQVEPQSEEVTKLPLLPLKTFDVPSNEIVPQTFPTQVRPEQANMAFRYRDQWQHAYDPSSGSFKNMGSKQATLPYGEKLNEHTWEYNKSNELPESGHHVWQVGNKKYYNQQEAKAAAQEWDKEHSYTFEQGGYLPEAQFGKNVTFRMSPYSLNANAAPLASKVFGEYNPELLIGATKRLPGKDQGKYNHNVSLDVGLPYSGKFVPSVKANYHGRYTGGRPVESGFLPTVHSDIHAGYDPQQGLNFGIMANPRAEFANNQDWKYNQQNWPHGAWKGYVGPTAGVGVRSLGFDPSIQYGDVSTAGTDKSGSHATGFYGGNAGFEIKPFRHSPVRMGFDASLAMNPAKKLAEAPYSDTPVGWTPMVKANLVYPFIPNILKKQEKAEEQRKKDKETFDEDPTDVQPVHDDRPKREIEIITPPDNGGGKRIRPDRKKREYEPVSLDGVRPIGFLPGYDPDSGREVGEEYTRRAYGFNEGPTMYAKGGKLGPIHLNEGRKTLRDYVYGADIGMMQEQDGGSIDTELTDEEIQAYRDAGYYIEELD
jgi:hypothetical protein